MSSDSYSTMRLTEPPGGISSISSDSYFTMRSTELLRGISSISSVDNNRRRSVTGLKTSEYITEPGEVISSSEIGLEEQRNDPSQSRPWTAGTNPRFYAQMYHGLTSYEIAPRRPEILSKELVNSDSFTDVVSSTRVGSNPHSRLFKYGNAFKSSSMSIKNSSSASFQPKSTPRHPNSYSSMVASPTRPELTLETSSPSFCQPPALGRFIFDNRLETSDSVRLKHDKQPTFSSLTDSTLCANVDDITSSKARDSAMPTGFQPREYRQFTSMRHESWKREKLSNEERESDQDKRGRNNRNFGLDLRPEPAAASQPSYDILDSCPVLDSFPALLPLRESSQSTSYSYNTMPPVSKKTSLTALPRAPLLEKKGPIKSDLESSEDIVSSSKNGGFETENANNPSHAFVLPIREIKSLTFPEPMRRQDSSETGSGSSYTETETDGSDSNFSLYSDLCDIVRDDIMDKKSSNQALIKPVLAPIKNELVEQLMEEFWVIFSHEWKTDVRECHGQGVTASGSRPTTASISDITSSPTQKRKRPNSGGDDDPDEDHHERDAKRSTRPGPALKVGGIRLACPFRKHDPQKYDIYNHRSCALSYWDSISRVKEHLYRRHRMPIHCPRCHFQFNSREELDSHVKVVKADVCELQPDGEVDGITPEIERQLRSRKRTAPNQSEEERWKAIYQLLFPNEPIPSPYFDPIEIDPSRSPDSQNLAEFEEYSRRELPRLVRNHLETAFQQETQPMAESLKRRLVDIIRDCHELVFSQYVDNRKLSQELQASFLIPPPPQGEQEERVDPRQSRDVVDDSSVPLICRPLPSQSELKDPPLPSLSISTRSIERLNVPINSDSGYETNSIRQSDSNPDDGATGFIRYPQGQKFNDDNYHSKGNIRVPLDSANLCSDGQGESQADVSFDLWQNFLNYPDYPECDGALGEPLNGQ